MDEAERKKLVDGIRAAIGERLKAAGIDDDDFLKKMAGRMAALEQHVAERGDGAPSLRGLDFANPFASDVFKQRVGMLAEGHKSTGAIPMAGVGIKRVKALINLPESQSPSAGFPTQPQRGPTVGPALAPLTLVDLLPSTPVSSDNFDFVQLSRTNNAAVQQDEGDLKPESEFTAELQTAKIATIAHYTMASRQVLADNAQLSSLLASILGIDVVTKYEGLLLNGNGTTDKIDGLVTQAPVLVHTVGPKADRIAEAISNMWTAGFVASAIVLNPADWMLFETERAVGGDEQYVAGGWANPAAPSMWRVPVARAASLAEGSALVIDTRFVTMLDRNQVTTALSTEDRDNFIRNLVTMLAEMRGGLAVYNVEALRLVDLAST